MVEKVNSCVEHEGLGSLLRTHLPFARAVRTALVGTGGLELYLLNDNFAQQELTTEQMHAILQYPAYWAFCWASGRVMAQYLAQNPAVVRNKRVLDFGSGSGVAAIAAALAGAGEVVACDLDPDACEATRVNAALNACSVDVRADYADCDGDFDIILVADVLYDRDNLSWLDTFLARASTVLVADSRVRNFSRLGYRKLGQWQSTTLPDLDEFDEFGQVSIYLGEVL